MAPLFSLWFSLHLSIHSRFSAWALADSHENEICSVGVPVWLIGMEQINNQHTHFPHLCLYYLFFFLLKYWSQKTFLIINSLYGCVCLLDSHTITTKNSLFTHYHAISNPNDILSLSVEQKKIIILYAMNVHGDYSSCTIFHVIQ